jgi:hypothetical protein
VEIKKPKKLKNETGTNWAEREGVLYIIRANYLPKE